MKKIAAIILIIFIQSSISAQKPRARDIGIPFDGVTGKYNAITDVKPLSMPWWLLKPMEGINGNKSYALPQKLVIDLLKKYNRIK